MNLLKRIIDDMEENEVISEVYHLVNGFKEYIVTAIKKEDSIWLKVKKEEDVGGSVSST